MAYESISLLAASNIDPIRLGVALKTAATVEAAESDTGFTVSMMWSAKSLECFKKYRHPFCWRAELQRAQCYVKADRNDDALEGIEAVRTLLDWSVSGSNVMERNYAEAEIALTEAWVRQRELLGPDMGRGLERTNQVGPQMGELRSSARRGSQI
jgi:hypothetical protein